MSTVTLILCSPLTGGVVPLPALDPAADRLSTIRNPQSAIPRPPSVMRTLMREYKWRVFATYGLFNIESLLSLAQPFMLGLAIDDLFQNSYRGLALLGVQHVLFVLLTVVRRRYDVRTFGRVCTDLAYRLVTQQRQDGESVSAVAARSALSREVVQFFERDIPAMVQVIYAILGGLVMLCWYDAMLVLYSAALLVPVVILNLFYARLSLRLNGELHDELEREVSHIAANDPQAVHGHYEKVNCLRIRLFDSEAANFGIMELAILGVIIASLVRCCSMLDGQVGDVFAIFRYVTMVVCGLQSVPMLVNQITGLKDIVGRVET